MTKNNGSKNWKYFDDKPREKVVTYPLGASIEKEQVRGYERQDGDKKHFVERVKYDGGKDSTYYRTRIEDYSAGHTVNSTPFVEEHEISKEEYENLEDSL